MANNTGKEKSLICSFCGKSQDEVDRMIIGPGVNICNNAYNNCNHNNACNNNTSNFSPI